MYAKGRAGRKTREKCVNGMSREMYVSYLIMQRYISTSGSWNTTSQINKVAEICHKIGGQAQTEAAAARGGTSGSELNCLRCLR